MFLYVNHQPELYVFIRQPPTSICLPLRYSFVWALQGNSIYSQPFGMNSQMIFPRICCLVVTVIMDPVSSKAGKSWKNTKWSTKDSDIMGYISLGTHTYVYIYMYMHRIYAPVVAYITNTMICGFVWKWGIYLLYPAKWEGTSSTLINITLTFWGWPYFRTNPNRPCWGEFSTCFSEVFNNV